jgi:polyhydroxyalkanoate synthesis regulator phasin
MATTATKGAPTQRVNGTATVTEMIETKSKAVEEAATKAGSTVSEVIETKSKAVQEAAAKAGNTVTEVIETKSKAVQEAATKAGDALVDWLRKLPLASLGLVATIGDETKAFMDKLFMNKLVERGELVQKDAEKLMKDLQARFR